MDHCSTGLSKWGGRISAAIIIGSIVLAVLRTLYKSNFDSRIRKREKPLEKFTQTCLLGRHIPNSIMSYLRENQTLTEHHLTPNFNTRVNDGNDLSHKVPWIDIGTTLRRMLSKYTRSRVYLWKSYIVCRSAHELFDVMRVYNHPTCWVVCISLFATNASHRDANNVEHYKYQFAILPTLKILSQTSTSLRELDNLNTSIKWPVLVYIFSNIPHFMALN